MRQVESSIEINANSAAVIDAFLEAKHLEGWWGVQRSLVEKKLNGVWTLAWAISDAGIKYTSTGIISAYEPSTHLAISNLVYLNPEKQILGPMHLELFADPVQPDRTQLKLIQSGYQFGEDWDWYYEAVVNAWPYALGLLKGYLEG
jgi:uncharacterized protein YndB with AHSA1/START domain